MTTELGHFTDAVDTAYSLDVYSGTAGVALFINGPTSKFWLTAKDARELSEILRIEADREQR